MQAGIFIVGTPIGHLDDLSRRAIATLQEADLILAEDTRHTRILLQRYAITGRLTSCHRFNEASRIHLAIERAKAGGRVALVSNAGMPTVSDPGARLVAACRRAGVTLTVIPGPSAVTAAVALSGFGGDRFLFEGFLPPKGGARRRRLDALAVLPYPVVLFESPYRFSRLLDELEPLLGEREMFVGRELTKLNEETRWGSACQLREVFAARLQAPAARALRGEFVLVLAPAPKGARPSRAPDAPPLPPSDEDAP